MSDLVKIDRGALLDLIKAISELTNIIANGSKDKSVQDLIDENNKIKYVDKLFQTAMESYKTNNQ
jgi:hypothetical protein